MVNGLTESQIDKNAFANNLAESNEIKLNGGHTTLKIDSFNMANKNLVVSVGGFAPDTSYPLKVLFSDPVGWIFLLGIICIVGLGLAFAYKRFRKSK